MEMAKNSSGAFCPPQHNISRQSAAVCRYGHARLCVMTRGVRAGETFEKVSPAHFQNFKTERLFRDARTKAVCSRKVSSTVAETRCECFGKCEAQTETSYWIAQRFNDPTERRFFSLAFPNNAKHCSCEVLRSCGARLPPITAKKNFMLNRIAIQRRLRLHKEKAAKALIHLSS